MITVYASGPITTAQVPPPADAIYSLLMPQVCTRLPPSKLVHRSDDRTRVEQLPLFHYSYFMPTLNTSIWVSSPQEHGYILIQLILTFETFPIQQFANVLSPACQPLIKFIITLFWEHKGSSKKKDQSAPPYCTYKTVWYSEASNTRIYPTNRMLPSYTQGTRVV